MSGDVTGVMQRLRARQARVAVCVALLASPLLASPIVAQPITVRDGAGLAVTLKAPARRVASLIGSTVDIMIALGAADRVAARTRYDTATAVRRAADMGGGIDPSVEVLIAARPDLFIAWNGQSATPVVSRMRALGVPVYLVDTKDTLAMYATIRDLGALLGMAPKATAAANTLRVELRAVQAQVRTRQINSKLRGVEVMGAPAAAELLELVADDAEDDEEP